MKDIKKSAAEIIENIGGVENVRSLSHCITRLRFVVNDDSKINKEAIENVEGVKGYAVSGDQRQVIIGADVEDVFRQIEKDYGSKMNIDSDLVDAAEETKGNVSFGKKIVDTLSGIIAPIIPAFCAAGMVKVLLVLLSTIGICTGEEGWWTLLWFVGDVAFYFLPILVAISAARRFKVDQGLALIVAGALVYPDYVNMVNAGEQLTFFGLNVPMYGYASTIFPALLGVLLLSYVYRFFNRVIKVEALKSILVPMLSVIVTSVVTFIVIAPLANWGANLLAIVFQWLMDTVGPIGGLVIGALMPVMTLTGLHQSLAPLEILEITEFGGSLVLAIEFWHNLAEAGAALGTSFFTKDKKMKTIAAETGLTAFVGVSEPALYAVMVKERASMLAAMIGNGIGGFLGVLFGIKGHAFVWPNIFAIPSFLGSNAGRDLTMLLVAAVATFVSAFLLVPVMNKVLNRKA